MRSLRATVHLLLVVSVCLSGCSGFFGDDRTGAESVTTTPAPVPPTSEPPTETPTPERNESAVSQPRYLSQSPTCERPPGLVIHIQVEALRNNDPATNEGIATVWRFAAPSNKQVTGPYRAFVSTIQSRYQPLLTAESITYGPLAREDGRVTREVTVRTGNVTTSYDWVVTRQSRTPYEGCWMTSGVIERSSNADT